MTFLLCLLLHCSYPARSRTEVHHFMQLHPCPSGVDKGSTCCGKDEPANMQWQTVEQGKAKDRWEGDCSTCGRKRSPSR